MASLSWRDGIAPPQLLYIDDTTAAHHIHCMHKHNRILEILLIQKGHGVYCVEDERYLIESGDIIICNAGSIHDQIPSDEEPYITSCIGLTDLQMPGLPPNCLIAPHSPSLFHHPAQFQELCALTALIRGHVKNACYSESDRLLTGHLTICLLEQVTQMITLWPRRLPQRDEPLVRQIKAYIDEHYAADLSLAQLSTLFYISPYHLSHLFKKHFEYPLMQYVIRRRIGEAQSLLMSTRASITDVAAQTGFADTSHFSKLFVKYVGMSPSEYRKYRSEKALETADS